MAKISIDSLIEFGDTFVRKNLADIPELELNLVTLARGAVAAGAQRELQRAAARAAGS